jgi:hypothetical protein
VVVVWLILSCPSRHPLELFFSPKQLNSPVTQKESTIRAHRNAPIENDARTLAWPLLGDVIPIHCVPRVSSPWIHLFPSSSDDDDCAFVAADEKFAP